MISKDNNGFVMPLVLTVIMIISSAIIYSIDLNFKAMYCLKLYNENLKVSYALDSGIEEGKYLLALDKDKSLLNKRFIINDIDVEVTSKKENEKLFIKSKASGKFNCFKQKEIEFSK